MNRAAAILTYHSLDDTGSVISLAPDAFRSQMKFLASGGIPVVPLAKVRETPGAVALTFDDAFHNFFDHAFPILCEYRFPATVFVVSGHCGGKNDWSGQSTGVPILPLMSWSDLSEISRHGIELGGHTISHPRLTALPEARVLEELRCGQEIEQRTGVAVSAFAYPYGNYDERIRRITADHYRFSVTTSLNYTVPHSDPSRLPRLDIYYLRSLRRFQTLRSPSGRFYVGARRILRSLRQGFGE